MTSLRKKWLYAEHAAAAAALLSREAGVEPLVARLLASRGIDTPAEATKFLFPSLQLLPDPFLMRDVACGADRLAAAVERGEKIVVHGDYDVDGITGVALLVSFFRSIGGAVSWFIPRRMEEGYGLSSAGVTYAATEGAGVLVTVDCGITAVQEARACAAAGIDLIITDHHTPPEILPEAYAVINPLRPGCAYPFKGLAGVGVAFNLLMAVRAVLRRNGYFAARPEPNLRSFLDLVALGTVADVVPLVETNRVLVKFGLEELTASRREGIRALKKVAAVDGVVTAGMVGFRLAPRLNACGRLEEASAGVELLLTEDAEEAHRLAGYLDDCNAERQNVERQILQEALAMATDHPCPEKRRSIVLASDQWHAGVIGIVASRLVERFHRPAILIALTGEEGKGSGRSIRNLHLYDALCRCSCHLQRFGGHRHAAGLTVTAAAVDRFAAAFEAAAADLLGDDDLIPELQIDAEASPAEITLDLAKAIELLQPFGMGNPEPVFSLSRAEVVSERVLKDQHLKLRLKASDGAGFDAIGFNLAAAVGLKDVDVAFTPQVNQWNGSINLQLRLRDIRPAGGADEQE